MFLAVFCLFSVIGFFSDLLNLGHTPYAIVLMIAILSGVIAVLYVLFGTRFPTYYTVLLTIAQILAWIGIGIAIHYIAEHFHLQAVPTEKGIQFAAVSILVAVILSYVFFLRFIRTEGQEAYRIKNELALAHGIQQTLVPAIHIRTEHFEIYGRSDPSDKVGGDIVDALQLSDGGCVAYVADIAGHGLQAGILMGMLKTAARTALLEAVSMHPATVLPVLMDRLNRVLPEVKEPQMYATFAGLRLNPDGAVHYALAAHPPILHYRKSGTEQISVNQFPLGLLPVSGFSSEATTMAANDLMIIVTDGILEACNAAEEEFGLERLQEMIAKNSNATLPQLSDAILSTVRAFGRQIDDQTLLIVKRL